MRLRCLFAPLFGLVTLAHPASAQTFTLGYATGAAQASGSSADYNVTVLSSATPLALLPMPGGVTVTGVSLGVLSFTDTGRGPSQVETIPFSFTRPLSLSLNGASPVMAQETISGTWGASTGGSFGQYLLTSFSLSGASSSYSLGNAGTLQADFQPGQAFYDGLGGSQTIPLMANFTFLPAAVPEPSPLGLLGLGGAMLAGTLLRARKKPHTRDV